MFVAVSVVVHAFEAPRDEGTPGDSKPERILGDSDRGLWLVARPAEDLQWAARDETHLSHVLPPGVRNGRRSVPDVDLNCCRSELAKSPDVDEVTVRPEAISVAVFTYLVGGPLTRRPSYIELEVVGLDLTVPGALRSHSRTVLPVAARWVERLPK